MILKFSIPLLAKRLRAPFIAQQNRGGRDDAEQQSSM